MQYRVENKYLVTDMEIAVLSQRLKTVMEPDVHQHGESYEIRSIYFDDICDTGMEDNENGIDCRKKYRIRSYGFGDSPVNLEIKEKHFNLTSKIICPISVQEYALLTENPMEFHFGEKAPLNELLLQCRFARMRPKAIITYERTAFVHPSGNVRITFDRNIMVSDNIDSFQAERIDGLIPVLPINTHILEVKYDEFLPDFIAKQLEIKTLRQTAFSKYYMGRLALIGSLY